MGTLRKTVNLAKAIFSRNHGKSIYQGRKARRISEEKNKEKTLNDPRKSGFKFIQNHTHGGGRQWNGQAIFNPRHRVRKGYEKDAQLNSTFNKRKKPA